MSSCFEKAVLFVAEETAIVTPARRQSAGRGCSAGLRISERNAHNDIPDQRSSPEIIPFEGIHESLNCTLVPVLQSPAEGET